MNELDYLDIESEQQSNIMVIGVGGGGGNAVKYMYDVGIHNVFFMICNTDAQALKRSPVPMKIQLGSKLTNGLGAGNQPAKGRDAALESSEEIKEQLKNSNAKMVFITAGMGGGTGTGAAPVIAEIAKELGILTVAIVTIPFRLEGPKRLKQAEVGLNEIKKHVDSMLVIDNENICKMYGDLDFSDAFAKADDILAIAAKGIAEAITKEHKVNVDFADVESTMSNSGIALLGYAISDVSADNVAIDMTEQALLSPLLNQNDIYGAKDILINISWGNAELKMNDVRAIIAHVQAAAGSNANIIWGAGYDQTLAENHASVIIIATGFNNDATLELGEDICASNSGFVTSDSKNKPSQQPEPQPAPVQEVAPAPQPQQEVEKSEESPVYVSLDDVEQKVEKKSEAPQEDGDMVMTTATKEEPKAPKPEAQSSKPSNDVPITHYSIDDLENIPAYLRRKILEQQKQDAESKERVNMEL